MFNEHVFEPEPIIYMLCCVMCILWINSVCISCLVGYCLYNLGSFLSWSLLFKKNSFHLHAGADCKLMLVIMILHFRMDWD